jgi:hypothetical protein
LTGRRICPTICVSCASRSRTPSRWAGCRTNRRRGAAHRQAARRRPGAAGSLRGRPTRP